MEKIVIWAEKYRKKWWFSAFLNLVLLAGLLVFMRPLFETNDDTTIYELTAGAKGLYDSHTFFIHVWIGQILKLFYVILPGIQWYTVFQYAVMYFSFTAISYVLFNRLKTGLAVVSFGILACFFASEGYIVIQFSKTAGYAACAGILLMFHGLEALISDKTRPYVQIFFGFLLALTGSMYRFKEFLLCAAVMSGIGIYTLLSLKWKESRRLFQTVCLYAGSFAALFLISLMLNVIDIHSYTSAEGWETYREFNDMRSNLLDYGFPDYETNQAAYEALGITKDDYNLYKSGNHADPELFDQEVIETLTALCQRKELNRAFVCNYFEQFPLRFFEIPAFTCFLLFGFCWLFWGQKSKGAFGALIYEILVIGMVYAYLFYMGRYLIRRTETALWMAAALMLIWLLKRNQEFFTMRTAAAFCSFVFAFTMNSWREELRFSTQQKSRVSIQKGEREFQEILGADKKYLYLTKLGTISTFTAYGPFDVVPEGLTSNICKLGGWEYGAATNDHILEQYGISNPYRDMIDHPQVLVVDDKVNTTLKYLKQHYNEAVEADLIKNAGGRSFYAFRSQPLTLEKAGCQAADEQVQLLCEQTWNQKKLSLSGCLYRQGANSFTQRIYLCVEDTVTGETWYRAVPTQAAEGKSELTDGLYGGFSYEFSLKNKDFSKETVQSGRYRLELILETEGVQYLVGL